MPPREPAVDVAIDGLGGGVVLRFRVHCLCLVLRRQRVPDSGEFQSAVLARQVPPGKVDRALQNPPYHVTRYVAATPLRFRSTRTLPGG